MGETSRKFSPQIFDGQTGIARRKNALYSPSMKFRLLIELDSQTKRWSAVFPELPGCATAGDTEKEAITNAKEALVVWFEPTPRKSGHTVLSRWTSSKISASRNQTRAWTACCRPCSASSTPIKSSSAPDARR
jgi:predicted RNase H-like HicB family nuclease